MNQSKNQGILLPEDRRVRQGAWLLIASLAVFFFSSIILYAIYVYIRWQQVHDDLKPFLVPRSFWLSTVILLATSYCLQKAVTSAKFDQSLALLRYMAVSLILCLAFFLVQSEGMYKLIQGMRAADTDRLNLHTMTLVLAVVHALHVVGGLVGILWVLVNAFKRKYDHERYFGVQYCALYWHFLDVVWLILLGSFQVGSMLMSKASA
jgi:cytochrome c oxidase subunit III